MKTNPDTQNSLSIIQNWYADQCSGDWEHSHGIRLDTLDNPGWILTVDFIDTKFQDLTVPLKRTDRDGQNWVQYEVTEGRFIGCGGALNLMEIFDCFVRIIRGQYMMNTQNDLNKAPNNLKNHLGIKNRIELQARHSRN
ncbi:MAG: immunity 53 family protein [Xanthomonadales bacterium]|nr:immunity 53 family protein [Xanthomonadales bacterium]